MDNFQGNQFDQFSMVDLYKQEVETQIEILTAGLLELENRTDRKICIETLMRAAHSIKGAAKIVGVEQVVGIAHLLEDCFVAAQRGEITIDSEYIDTFLVTADVIVKISLAFDENSDQATNNHDPLVTAVKTQLTKILPAIREKKYFNKSAAFTKEKEFKENKVEESELVLARENLIGSNKSNQIDYLSEISIPFNDEKLIRLSANRMTKILGLSSEFIVEAHWLQKYYQSMLMLKKRQVEISTMLERVRESINNGNLPYSVTQLVEVQNKMSDSRNILTERIIELDDFDRRNNQLAKQIYNEVVSARMRPFKDATRGLHRLVRDVSRTLNKKVDLVIKGLETPVDRDILDKIKSPLSHLVRNSIDHGIESLALRKSLNKPEVGTIVINATHVGGMLLVQIEDDGAGVDVELLRRKVISRNLIDQKIARELNHAEILDFLFLPDFSTQEKVTEISGRGVGLDIVRNFAQENQGTTSVENRPGRGLKIVLQMPLTLSILTALVVDIKGEYYAFPLTQVDKVVKISIDEVSQIEGYQYFSYENEHIGLVSASQVLELDNTPSFNHELSIVVIKKYNIRYGIVVSNFVGRRQLSIQPLDARLGKLQDISAAALSEDGRQVLVFDVEDLVRTIHLFLTNNRSSKIVSNNKIVLSKKRILVIDDSLTVREIEKNLLQIHGYSVDVAVDGMDGWNALRRTKYNLVITDIDMPRMDGITLVSNIKRDSKFSTLPVMIVSYKDRKEDKQKGMEAGADYYLTKGSFHDDTLVEAVKDLIGEAVE